jgi:hypothetical protein
MVELLNEEEVIFRAECEQGLFVCLSGAGFDCRIIGVYETARITEVVSAIK